MREINKKTVEKGVKSRKRERDRERETYMGVRDSVLKSKNDERKKRNT